MAALTDAVMRGAAPILPPITLAELHLMFTVAEKHRLKSWRCYEQRWRDAIEPVFGARNAGDIKVDDIDRYRAKRLGELNHRGQPMKLATINLEIAQIRKYINFGKRRGRVAVSHLHGPGMTSELIHRPSNVRTTIVEENAKKSEISLPVFLAAATDHYFRTYLRLLHHAGPRRTETGKVRWDRIDWDREVAWVPDVDTKGGDGGRWLPLSRETIRDLELLPRFPDCPLVFTNPRRRKPFHPDHWSKKFRKLCRAMGLTGPDGPIWLHDLRRSFITLSRRRGEGESDIMKVSGHKTRSVFDRYNVMSTSDVLAFKARADAARKAELQGPRKPPRRTLASRVVVAPLATSKSGIG